MGATIGISAHEVGIRRGCLGDPLPVRGPGGVRCQWAGGNPHPRPHTSAMRTKESNTSPMSGLHGKTQPRTTNEIRAHFQNPGDLNKYRDRFILFFARASNQDTGTWPIWAICLPMSAKVGQIGKFRPPLDDVGHVWAIVSQLWSNMVEIPHWVHGTCSNRSCLPPDMATIQAGCIWVNDCTFELGAEEKTS